jgi:hypothetical protein
VAGGFLLGREVARAVYAARASERTVTVRGFAEREVAANLVIWPIAYTATGDDLGAVHAKLEADATKVAAFLEAQGFPAEEISRATPRVRDREAEGFGDRRPTERYQASAAVTVRSTRVDAVRGAMQRAGELVRDGVALSQDYESQPQFLFTSLDAIKPEMIAEATKDARRAAEQFARDSGSRVGGIRSAQQGLFTIEDRDRLSPEQKKVRVVTTVQYFLEGS